MTYNVPRVYVGQIINDKLNRMMTTIEKIEKGIITLAEFTEDQQSFIRGIVKLSFNEGQEQALRIHDVVGGSEQFHCTCVRAKGLDYDEEGIPY